MGRKKKEPNPQQGQRARTQLPDVDWDKARELVGQPRILASEQWLGRLPLARTRHIDNLGSAEEVGHQDVVDARVVIACSRCVLARFHTHQRCTKKLCGILRKRIRGD